MYEVVCMSWKEVKYVKCKGMLGGSLGRRFFLYFMESKKMICKEGIEMKEEKFAVQ
jgi:hypothetical protein